jgi:hypothetical protein
VVVVPSPTVAFDDEPQHREGGEQHDRCAALVARGEDAVAIGDEHAGEDCREA